ncbi:MAG: insulinase family protein [Pseudomonadales bacterium]
MIAQGVPGFLRGLLFALQLGLLLSSCALLPQDGKKTAVISSPSDAREFRYIELPNRLKLLLISDPAAERAAASLDVAVGNRNDPENFAGLSHFLEHMLFLGTARYPEPDDWHRFVSKHGGSHNAYTSFEHTNYYFSIGAEQFDEALDRFADFFVAPLLTDTYIERELQAVEAEFRARIDDEPRRVLDALREVLNEAHPLANFSGGNLQTLDKPGLREALLEFQRRWYGAERMALALSGPHSLDELEAMAVARFASVAQRGTQITAVDAPLLALQQADAGQVLAVQTQKPLRELQLSFPMPDLRAYSEYKALHYIGNILGHEGPGSLHAALKASGLVESLSAGSAFDYHGGSLYQLKLVLSEKGMAAIDRVVAAVLHQVAQARRELQLDPAAAAARFAEQRQLADLHWRFYVAGSPLASVTAASANLHYYPPQDVMYGDYRTGDFNPELVEQLLARMTPDNLLLVIAADKLPGGFEPERVSQWYNAPYSLRLLPKGWHETWMVTLQGAPVAGIDRVSMPAANRFIPRDFTLYSAANMDAVNRDVAGQAVAHADTPAINAPPQRYAQVAGREAWYKVDDRFELPRASINIAFLSGQVAGSARRQALANLYALALGEQLQQSIYPAYLAGMSASFYPTLRGFVLKLGGYNDSLPALVEQIVAELPAVKVEPQRFGELIAELERRWTLDTQIMPYQRLAAIASTKLYPQNFDRPALIAALRTVQFDELQNFARDFWASSFQQLLVHGNIDPTLLQSLLQTLDTLPRCNCTVEDVVPIRITRLPTGTRVETVMLSHADHALHWYFQAGDKRLQSVAMAMLSTAILEPRLFAELRTEQQLGYVVSTHYHALFDWPGIALSLQSPEHDALALAAAVEAYLADFAAQPVGAAAFAQHRTALLRQLREEDVNLPQRSGRYWRALMFAQDFDYRLQLADALEQVDAEQWQHFLREMIAPQTRRSLQSQATPR